jgi:hypothetical protein
VTQSPTPANAATPSVPVAEDAKLWVVSIYSSPDREEAERALKELTPLKGKAQIFLAEAVVNEVLHHRVLIGYFSSEEAANTARTALLATGKSNGPYPYSLSVKESKLEAVKPVDSF